MVARNATAAEPTPAWAAELLREVTGLRNEVRRLTQPVSLLTVPQLAKRLARSERAADELARRLFTDCRDPGERRPGVRRLVKSDEVEVYCRLGSRGLRQYRRDTGRLA